MFGSRFKRGIDISPGGIRWVEMKGGASSAVIAGAASGEIPEGLVNPAFSKENVTDRESLKSHLIDVIPAGRRRGDIALSLPDQLARITLLEFDEIPGNRVEVERLILWKLKKTLPIPVEVAKVDYTLLDKGEDKVEMLVAAASREVIREYEDIVRSIGLRPILVDIASMNTLSLFRGDMEKYSVFVDVSGYSVSVAIIADGKPAFFRSKELEGDIDRIEKEVISTVAYYTTKNPEADIGTLFIHSAEEFIRGVIDALRGSFGKIVRLRLSQRLKGGGPAKTDEEFSGAAGAALRLWRRQ